MKHIVIFIFILLIIFNLSSSQENYKNNFIKSLIRQSARWSIASLQDENPLIAVLHANYGAGYLWAITDLVTSSEIEKATGIDYIKFKKKIVDVQDKATMKLSKVCPRFMPKHNYLTKIAKQR
jgi:hypothetical protein